MTRSVLLVDDDAAVLGLLVRFFERRGWTVATAVTGAGALEQYDRERTGLVLLDLALPDGSGLPILQQLRERDPDVTVIMLTGHGDIATAVEAMRVGAENFLSKPVELEHLGAVMDRAAEKLELRRRNRVLSGAHQAARGAGDLGPSPLMRALSDRAHRVAAGTGTVLLEGETGTGKGWVARLIHARSDRATAPFVEVNCAGVEAAPLESEIFGHEKDAFPAARTASPGLFELAHGGTVFLEEIGDLPPELQPKLLNVLETRRFRRIGGGRDLTVDVRLIAATTRDLRKEVAAGRFREDLFYRIAVLPLRIPPLRERAPEDVAALAYGILRELSRDFGFAPARLGDDALEVLCTYPWPGNVRELRNILERSVILSEGAAEIRAHHLSPEIRRGEPVASDAEQLTLEEVERRHIMRVLEVNRGNRARSARTLGISRATLYEKLDRYGLRTVGR